MRRQQTGVAFGFARLANQAAMLNHPMRKDRPFFLRHDCHQIALDFFRRFLRGEAQALRQAPNVGVNHHAGVDSESVAEHDVGSFAPDPGKLRQLFHRARHVTVVSVGNGCGARFEIFGFVVKESAGPDQSFQFGEIGVSHCRRGGIFFKKRRGDFVDGFVRRLRGENRCGQQLERIFEVQRAFRLRI